MSTVLTFCAAAAPGAIYFAIAFIRYKRWEKRFYADWDRERKAAG